MRDCQLLIVRLTWQQALVLAETQNISGFAGFIDWRVPKQKKLRTLVTRNCYNPSSMKVSFPMRLQVGFGRPRRLLKVLAMRGSSFSCTAMTSSVIVAISPVCG